MAASRNSGILNQAVLALVFTISFVIYLAPELSISLQLIPLLLFAALVFCKALTSDSLIAVLAIFFDSDGLLYIGFLSVLMVACSLGSSYGDALRFALLLSACLVLARIYMTLIPIKEVLEAFYWSAIVSMLIFVPLGFDTLFQSAMNLERLRAFNFHPNGLALQLAGYLCVMFWKFRTSGWLLKVVSSIVGLVCAAIMFLTSSRGAILGSLAGLCFAIGLALTGSTKQRRKAALRLLTLILAGVGGLFVVTRNLDAIKNGYEAVDGMLAITSNERGLDSGMTGRVDVWQEVMRALRDGSWLFGHGIRSSDTVWSYDPKIDNSYLVILYDMGVAPLFLIAWRFVSMLQRAVRNYLAAVDQSERKLHLACGTFLVVLLVTSIVERSLFAVGNPFSFLAFLFFATPTRCFERHRPLIVPVYPGQSLIQSGQATANW